MIFRNKQVALIGTGTLLAIAGVTCLGLAIWFIVINLTAGNDAAQRTLTEEELAIYQQRLAPVDTDAAPLSSLVSVYPGRFVNPRFWSVPDNLRDEFFGIAGIPSGFEFVELGDNTISEQFDFNINNATNISIPAINVSSEVEGLELISEDGQSVYETPDGLVGFIPDSGKPGSENSGWYFGHLQSLDEGNVFRHLPEITEKVRNDPVDVFITTAEHEFIYRVSATYEVHRDDLFSDLYQPSIQESDYAIYLCTCWPPRNYTQRIVIKANLIAFKGGTDL